MPLVYAAALLAVIVAVWMVARPAPPKEIRFTSGTPGGAYHEFAQRYAQILARDGVRVIVEPSQGTLDNVARLRSEAGRRYDVGFVQSGVAGDEDREGLVSLGAVFHEPLWVFHRAGLSFATVLELRARRISVGPKGGGSRAISERVLKAAGIDATNGTLLELPLAEAAKALLAGEIDVLMQVASPEAPAIQTLMRSPQARVLPLVHADAYVRRIPSITRVVLPAGAVDLVAVMPAADVPTLASVATLVTREDLHPAIQYLLVRAARELHSGPSLLNASREFPNLTMSREFDVPEEIERLYASGPPFLYRHLPFWLANLLNRLWVLVIPVLAVLLSATDWVPKVLGWHGSRTINAIYRDALKLEYAARDATDEASRARLQERLASLRERADDVWLPRSLVKTKYELRGHLDLVAATIAGISPIDASRSP